MQNDRSHLSRSYKRKDAEVIECIDEVEDSVQVEISNMDHESFVQCLICNDKKLYKRKGGLKIHCTRKHKDEDCDFMFEQLMNSNTAAEAEMNFEEKLSYYKNNVRVLRRIPKGARYLAAHKLLHIKERWRKLAEFVVVLLQWTSSSR